MIVFQIKGQSHRFSTLKVKEKDVIKNFSTYSIKYTEDTEVLGRLQLYDCIFVIRMLYDNIY